jgi:hypothetical protein
MIGTRMGQGVQGSSEKFTLLNFPKGTLFNRAGPINSINPSNPTDPINPSNPTL